MKFILVFLMGGIAGISAMRFHDRIEAVQAAEAAALQQQQAQDQRGAWMWDKSRPDPLAASQVAPGRPPVVKPRNNVKGGL